MAATIADFQDFADDTEDLCVQWPIMARALQSLGPFFVGKFSTGTEPDDVLHGVAMGIDGQSTTALDWRVFVDASGNFDIDENTGTDGSPTWTTRLSLTAGTTGIDNTYIASAAAIALNKLAATTASRALVSDGSGFITAATTTATEIGYVNGVTSAIQTQIDGKEDTISLTASRAVVSDGGGALAVAATTATEIGYVNGVTSAIQTQINARVADTGDTMTGQLLVSLGTGAELTNSCIRAFGYSPAFEVLDKDSIQNFFFGIDDDDSDALHIGRGYGPGQGIAPSLRVDATTGGLSVENADAASRLVQTDANGELANVAALTANRALVSDGNGIPTVSATTATELGYVNGVTSAIQTQLNGKLNIDGDAADVAYDNTTSGLTATDVQAAIDEVAASGGGGGDCVLLAHSSFTNSASADFDGDLPATGYQFFIMRYRVSPDTDSVALIMRIDTNGGASYETTNYTSVCQSTNDTGADQDYAITNGIALAGRTNSGGSELGNEGDEGCVGEILIFPGDGTLNPYFSGHFFMRQANNLDNVGQTGGRHTTATRIDSVQVLATSGNIDGEISLYGVTDS